VPGTAQAGSGRTRCRESNVRQSGTYRFLIHTLDGIQHVCQRVGGLDAPPGRLNHGRLPIKRAQHGGQRRGKRLGILGRHQVAFLPMPDHLPDISDGRRDHGQARRHRFQHGQRQALPPRWLRVDIGCGKPRPNIVLRAHETDLAGEACRTLELLKVRALLAVSHDDQPRVSDGRRHVMPGAQQIVIPLFGREPTDAEDDAACRAHAR
jgi:hypothetical protein